MDDVSKGKLKALRLFMDNDVVSELLPPCVTAGTGDCVEQDLIVYCPSCTAYKAWERWLLALNSIETT